MPFKFGNCPRKKENARSFARSFDRRDVIDDVARRVVSCRQILKIISSRAGPSWQLESRDFQRRTPSIVIRTTIRSSSFCPTKFGRNLRSLFETRMFERVYRFENVLET